MTDLNANQLAFITKETVLDTRKKMIAAWCKEKGLQVPELDYKSDVPQKKQLKKLDQFPERMTIEFLARTLNLPNLGAAVQDIKHNYLKRSETSTSLNILSLRSTKRNRYQRRYQFLVY